MAGGHISSEIQEHAGSLPDAAKVFLSFATLEAMIGEPFPREILRTILGALEIQIDQTSEEGFDLTIPRYRVDVTRPADVIEEVLRVYGYNAIQDTTLKYVAMPGYNYKSSHKVEKAIADLLVGQGFYEMLNNSISSPEHKVPDFLAPIRLLNPLGTELSQLRQSLLFNALEVVAFNVNRQSKNLKLFEFGKVYGRKEQEFIEEKRLGVVLTGNMYESTWNSDNTGSPFYFLKGIVLEILKKIERFKL